MNVRHGTSQPSPLRQDVLDYIAEADEPFLVPDVRPRFASSADVFHVLRDLVDEGELTYGNGGYRRNLEIR